jgi:type III pantothenate kinase
MSAAAQPDPYGAAPRLLVDAGNTRIKWALTDARGMRLQSGVLPHSSFGVPGHVPPPDWRALAAPAGIWLSNVAGQALASALPATLTTLWPHAPCHVVRARSHQCGVTNGYEMPHTLGSDRWCALIAARAAYPGETVLVATFGTATTLEWLTAHGIFTGGLIAPGLDMMMRALGEGTAQLPLLRSRDAAGRAQAAGAAPAGFAAATPTSIVAGCTLAQAALVERAWHDVRMQDGAPPRCIVSGGAAIDVMRSLTIPVTYREDLVLEGLARIALAGADNGG